MFVSSPQNKNEHIAVCLFVDRRCTGSARNTSVYVRSVRVQNKTRKCAVLVVVAPVSFSAIQFDVYLVARVQVEDHAVARVIIVLVRVLSNSASTDLWNLNAHD